MPADLVSVCNQLFLEFGEQKWWPARTRLEVMVGAILTQNTTWVNVEKSIRKLKQHHVLNIKTLGSISERKLSQFIKSSVYFRQKARHVKGLIHFIAEHYHGSIHRMFRTPKDHLRQELLSVRGIGPESADSILLYAGKKLTFVVDQYTKRIFIRHGWISSKANYSDVQNFIMKRLPQKVSLYNEYHALLVQVGKGFCFKTKPNCEACPLKKYLPKKGARPGNITCYPT